jgi:4-diphosphocytidyl-2-C-methyl-D-erythritol kinase
MIVTQSDQCVTVQAPAKVNLFLELHGRRPDGYHEIETVMQAVTLYDRIELRPGPAKQIELQCSEPELPLDDGNIAYRAAALLDREIGLPQGVQIRLEKGIPHGAGLGGGSSDAAGVLAGINRLFGLGLGLDELAAYGAELGSDVPFFVRGGVALCEGRGERITPVPSSLAAYVVICRPRCVLSTRAVYENMDSLGLTSGEHNSSFVLDSLAQGQFVSTCAHLFNRLERAAIALAPVVGQVREQLAAAASGIALVSGSGSSVYALIESADEAHRVAERMQAGLDGQVFVAQTEPSAE